MAKTTRITKLKPAAQPPIAGRLVLGNMDELAGAIAKRIDLAKSQVEPVNGCALPPRPSMGDCTTPAAAPTTSTTELLSLVIHTSRSVLGRVSTLEAKLTSAPAGNVAEKASERCGVNGGLQDALDSLDCLHGVINRLSSYLGLEC